MTFGFSARASQRIREDALRQALQLADHDIKRVLAHAEVRETAPGEVIVRKGDAADAMYVIVSGRFEVSVPNVDGRARALRILGNGRAFGEMGLLEGTARTADVISRLDGELLVLSAKDVRYVLDGAAHKTLSAEAQERKAQLDRVTCSS
jgi:CRP-like cAMP-binding protein